MFTPGQHVILITDGRRCIYHRAATCLGEAPRLSRNGKPHSCAYAIVSPIGSSAALLVHRASLRAAEDGPGDPNQTATPTTPAPPAPPVTAQPAERPPIIAIVRAEALLAQADRLMGYAETLRAEARILLGEGR